MSSPVPHTELLSPAGDWDCLRAAVANGADAVYFGLPRFNARQRATNFQPDELDKVVDFLHDHNVRAYVAFNTLIFPDELDEAGGYVRAIARSGADAVIVQDLGLAELIRGIAPTLPIHASTQMTLTEARGIELVRALGVQRVILARELSLAQIAAIRSQTDVQLEVFVHGAMCISVSGQCQASNVLFGKSGNRGQCGQPCRLPYELVVNPGSEGGAREMSNAKCQMPNEQQAESDLAFGNQHLAFPLLSPRDLAGWDRVGQLVALGVAGLKIEGRLKDATYVAAATAAYRAALDAALAGEKFELSADHRRALAMTFSRGWTHGYLDGVDHQQLVSGAGGRSGRAGKSRGLLVGTVAGVTPGSVIVQLDDSEDQTPIAPGDGVVFDEGLDEGHEQGGRIFAVRPYVDRGKRTGISIHQRPGTAVPGTSVSGASRGQRRGEHSVRLVELEFGRDAIRASDIRVGTPVLKTSDPQLRKRIEATFSREVIAIPDSRRTPLIVRVEAAVGRPVRLIVRDSAGHVAEETADTPAERAIKHPLTVEQLREPFSRLVNTPFRVETIEVSPPEGDPNADIAIMVPKSVLNDLRRRAVESLIAQRRESARHAVNVAQPPSAVSRPLSANRQRLKTGLGILVRSRGQLGAVLAWRTRQQGDPLAVIYCDLADHPEQSAAVADCRQARVPVGLATTRIVTPGDDAQLESIVEAAPDAVLVRNLAALDYLRPHLSAAALIGDWSLNVANGIAASWLFDAGLDCVTPACELTTAHVAAMLSAIPPERIEVMLHHHPAMFHTQHCVLAASSGRGRDSSSCGRPCRGHAPGEVLLVDRMGERMAVLFDAGCRSTVYACRPVFEQANAGELLPAGVRRFRVELLTEPPDAIGPLLDRCAEAISPA